MHRAGHREESKLGVGPLAVGAVLSEWSDRRHHHVRPGLRKGIVADAESLHRAGPHALDNYVAAQGQFQKQLPSTFKFQVESYALPIGVQVKVESYSLGLVDLLIWLDDGDRQVDLNDLGAVVGQHFGAVRAGDPVGQLQHAYAIEGHLWQV